MKFFDSHSHLNFPQYDKDRDEVIERMRGAGVETICVGTSLETSRESVRLAEAHADIWATVGVHPTDTDSGFDEQAFEDLLSHSRVVAVGECGLDYFRITNQESQIKQKEAFKKQIGLAQKHNLPLMIHCRPSAGSQDAYLDLIGILRGHTGLRGTVHFFVGNQNIAQTFLDMDFYLSFAGPVTFTDEYDTVITLAPLERILIETDAPFAAPAPYRGGRNEPAYVTEVATKIAQVKDTPLAVVMAQTAANVRTLFAL